MKRPAWLTAVPLRLADAARLAAGAIASLALLGWFAVDLSQPLSFLGDHMLMLGYARSYLDGNGFRWNESLGLPGVKDFMVHVTFNYSQKVILWVTARFVERPEQVVHIFYVVGVSLLFLSSYWALRHLAFGRALAWIGGLVMVVTPYVASRAGGHDMLALYYSVPLGVVLALRFTHADDRHVSIGRYLADPLSWVLIVLVGISGVYYAFFTMLFVGFASLFAVVVRHSGLPLVRAGLLAAGMLVVLVASGPGVGLLEVVEGDVQPTRRLPVEQLYYGLDLGDARRVFAGVPLVPDGWARRTPGLDQEGNWNEWPGVMLTLVILASPGLVVWAGLRARREDDRQWWLVTVCAALVVCGLAFATRGGLGYYFNQLVTPEIRAQNRVTPFLAFFALIVVLTGIERARASAVRSVATGVPLLLVGGLLISAWPSVGALHIKQARFLADVVDQRDRQSIEGVLARIHERGARAILQLPVVAWPEMPRVRRFDPYRFELPHILDVPRSPVRWSYGLAVSQPAFGYLAATVDGHREMGLAPAAVNLGFDAILIEKAALSEEQLAMFTHNVEQDVPRQCRAYEDDRRLLYHLGPAGSDRTCVVAVGRSAEIMRYVTVEGRYGVSLLRRGWSVPEAGFTWTHAASATIAVPIPPVGRLHPPTALELRLIFQAYRPDPNRAKAVVFRVGGRQVHRLAMPAGEPAPSSTTFTVDIAEPERARQVELELVLPDAEQPSAYGQPDDRLLGLALQELHVRPMR